MRRYELLKNIKPVLDDVLVVCNIGIPSQELYSLGDRDNYFYMLGGMGLCSSVALGLAQSTSKPVVAIEGDGAVLMNLGTLATIGNTAPDNFVLFIVDNGSYGSTGDQYTFAGGATDLAEVARAAGCRNVIKCSGADATDILAGALAGNDGPTVIVAGVDPGSEKVGVIPLHPVIIRERFRALVAASD